MNTAIFRDYDIRGVYNKDFNQSDAELIGKAFGTYIQKISGSRLVIGHDNRFSSDEINASLISGLLGSGCAVTDVGLSLTPLVHFSVIKYGFDGGVMVTASHNPKEFNGFRFDAAGGKPLYGEAILDIRKIVEEKSFKRGDGRIEYTEVFGDYMAAIQSRIELKRPLKVVIDCGNGTPSAFAPLLFERLGAQVVSQHCFLHGDYPYHQPDPEEKLNMRDGVERVLKEKADLGIGFDTDGDRFGIIDEKGHVYENDKILIVLARDLLKRHPRAKVIFDVKSSYVLPQEIKRAGGVPLMMKTGHPYFKAAMDKDSEILLGGEVSSHTFIKENYYGYDDGLFAAAKVLQILSEVLHPFSDFFQDVVKTAHTEELKAFCPDEQKFTIEKELTEEFKRTWEVIDLDGARVKFSETAWALVRASNTTPAISLRFEAENSTKLNEIIEIVEARLQKYPVVDTSCLSQLECRKTERD